MNFLALVQDLARQSGTLAGGTTLSSVTGVSGRADKLVNWIASAWEDIQNQRRWNFLRAEFTEALTIDVARYTASGWGIPRFGAWVEDTRSLRVMTLYDPDIGQSDENELRKIPYDVWKQKYDRRTHDASRPIEWAISPARELCIGPKPDKAYVMRGEHWKSPQVLVANTDEPEAPAELHKIIVYRAMILMAAADESVPTLQFAEREYRRLFSDMSHQCLPSVSTDAGALA